MPAQRCQFGYSGANGYMDGITDIPGFCRVAAKAKAGHIAAGDVDEPLLRGWGACGGVGGKRLLPVL